MKKFLFLAVLAITCLFGVSTPAVAADAPVQLINVAEVLNKFEHSVLLLEKAVQIGEEIKYRTKGCCVCVLKEGDNYTFLTANHVVEGGVRLRITEGINSWEVTDWKALEDTDAAYFSITQTNATFLPIPLELSPSSNVVPSIALGMWAGTRSLTGTFGYINRSVRGAWVDKVYDYKTVYGLIEGTALIYSGFSGGALVDESGRLLGINVLLGGLNTSFVDIRYIWNSVPALNKGKRIKVPLDNEFDVLGIPIIKRVSIRNTDVITQGKVKGKVSDLIKVIDDNPAFIDSILEDSIIELSEGVFRVARIEFESKNVNVNKSFPYRMAFKYCYLTGKGWSLIIYLGEVS